MVGVDFSEADLSEVLFDNFNLIHSIFIDVIANKADFSTSYDFDIDPEQNKLKKAILHQII